jgi:predicted  nucleic acid-binding Zn-ribbon protein
MKKRHLTLAMIALTSLGICPTGMAQRNHSYENVRSTVQRTQDDLTQVRSQGTRNDKERERLDNARKHLSDFDRNLSKNKFDKGRLDSAIDDVKNVVENNTLEARDRDALAQDLTDLRRVRAMRGE